MTAGAARRPEQGGAVAGTTRRRWLGLERVAAPRREEMARAKTIRERKERARAVSEQKGRRSEPHESVRFEIHCANTVSTGRDCETT